MIKEVIGFFEKEVKLSWFITIVIAATIFWISSLTFEPGTPQTTIYTLLYHIIVFFFLGGFLLISLVQGKNKNLIIVAILLAIIYAISDEIHQFFVPGRTCAFFDVGLNFVGISLAFLIYFISLELRKNQGKYKKP